MASENCKFCEKTGYTNDAGYVTGWLPIRNIVGGVTGYYCSNKCKIEAEGAKSSTGNANQSESGTNNEEAKAKAAEAKSQENASKWNAYAKLGTAAFSAASSTGKEVKETTDYLAKLIFSNDSEELGNQLSEISSMWGGAEKYMIKDNTEAVKKAAYEKFEFGIMKLEQVGTPSQIEFFKKKQKEMKPKKFFGLF